jgi:hypothetical protein
MRASYEENIRSLAVRRHPCKWLKTKFDIAPPFSVKPGYGGIHQTMSKLKVTMTGFIRPLVLLFGSPRTTRP